MKGRQSAGRSAVFTSYQNGITFSGTTGMRGGMNHNSRAQFIAVIRSLWNRCSPLRQV